MRILMVSSRFLPSRGGVERHIEEVSKSLVQLGHEVEVLTLQHSPNLSAKERISDLTVYRLSSKLTNKITQLKAFWWGVVNRKLLGGFDLIHGHDLYFPLLVKFSQKPYFHTFHGYEGYPISEDSISRRSFIEQKAQKTVCAGAFIEKWYHQRCDLVEWGAVTPPENTENASKSDLCFLGRLEKDTGVMAYVEALRLLKEAGHSLKMTICGSGSLENKIKEVKKRYNLNLDLIGFTQQPGHYLNSTNIACTSGYLGILESMIRSKMVAAYYDNPLKKDYLNLTPYASDIIIADTPQRLADSIAHYLQNPSIWNQRIKKNLKFAQEQTWEKLATQYLNLYREVGLG